MNLKNLINKSRYGTVGYVSSLEDLEILENYILYNLPVLKEFKEIIISTNFQSYPQLVIENTNLWKKYFPNCVLLDSKINRGHNFGTADLDGMLFDYCKSNKIKWLCKSSNDAIFQESVLIKEIKESDFYYMNGIGYGGMVKYDFDNEHIISEDFYPQTNFYFINVSKTDYLNNKEYINKTYNEVKNIPNYNGKIWEYFEGWSCEDFLKQCIERNNLSKTHLISREKYIYLLNLIKQYHIHDPSHKNIMIEGVCHFQYPQQQIIEI